MKVDNETDPCLQENGNCFKDVAAVLGTSSEMIIEVRDSRTGNLVPGRDGLGARPNGRVLGKPPPPPSPPSLGIIGIV